MSKINVLSSKIYNRISAGEVVERPASVVKELVENSIDAGATCIYIEIENGGISTIRITDDGAGIERSELRKAILPHATSKISKISDLDDISTLGFRGEALASIAAVSKLTIISKTDDGETGAMLYAEGGEDVEITDHPAVTGTEITVNNLFFNTPAREKFLKTDKTEESEISSVVAKFILGNSNIAFTYLVNGKSVYQSYGDGEESAFTSVYGVNTLKDCLYINTEKNGICLKGYIGKQYFSKPNRTYQSVFLNGRYIVNSTISSAIMNAYSAYLMKRQYPFYSISISMPTSAVDVNVHPNKIDVRFSDNRIVYGSVYNIISKVLDGCSEILDIVESDVEKGENGSPNDKEDLKQQKSIEKSKDIKYDYDKHIDYSKAFKRQDFSKINKVIFEDGGKRAVTDLSSENSGAKNDSVDIFAENKAFLEKLEREKNAGKTERVTENKPVQSEIKIERELKYVGQALNTFLIFDDGADMFFIDQHAAHERILFDKFSEQVKNDSVDTQLMLLPYVFDLSPRESDFIISNLPVIKSMGLDIEEFGDGTFKVSSIPVVLADIDLKEFLDEILSDIEYLKKTEITDVLKEKIAQKACKAAIKSGDKLSDGDIKYILTAIKSDLGLKCPHGRPIAIRITRTEIDKWFKRIV